MSSFANDVTYDVHAAETWWHILGPATSVNVREAGPPIDLESELFWSVDADCFDGIENASASSAAGFGRKQLMPGAGSVATPTRTLQGLPRKKTTHAVTGPR